MTATLSIERLISLALARELAGARLSDLTLDAVRRIYGRVVIQAMLDRIAPDDLLELLDRYGISRELLSLALQPGAVLAILDKPSSRADSISQC